ncbi:hypothetical protein J6590_040982 [Homalodisca vitripennis]|nr:hypothetical protein J6590_040982 [Homalodisca vitripennis]
MRSYSSVPVTKWLKSQATEFYDSDGEEGEEEGGEDTQQHLVSLKGEKSHLIVWQSKRAQELSRALPQPVPDSWLQELENSVGY